MKQEDKELLLQDLCARLPYKIRCSYYDICLSAHCNGEIYGIENKEYVIVDGKCIAIEFIKPYLFPLSSITKEHRGKISEILKDININHPPYGLINPNGCDALLTTVTMQGAALIEFYNKYHYDYNGLISNCLAIDATGLNIYKEETK